MYGAKKRTDIRSLTGIRGIAALWVVIYHLTIWGGHRLSGPAGNVLSSGYLAVDLFFILSGFVISLSYGGFFERDTSAPAFLSFMLRRIARIYPLYLLILVAAYALPGLFHIHLFEQTEFSLSQWLSNLTMSQELLSVDSINSPSWSVSAEFCSYLIFPFLCLGILRAPWSISAVISGICISILIYISSLPTPAGILRNGPMDVYWTGGVIWPVLRCLCEFSLGMMAYRMATMNLHFFTKNSVCYFLAISTIFCLTIRGADIVSVLLFPFFIVSLMNEKTIVARFFSSTPVHQLGLWSYAIYLWHRSCLFIAGNVWGDHSHLALAARFVLFLSVLLTLAALSYRYLELPARNLIRAFERSVFPVRDQEIAISEASAARHAEKLAA